jgi:O-antigen/teichoic acid export membrane protein
MIGPRAVFRPAAVYTATSAVNAAIPLLLLPVMTRVLSPTEYGTVAMFSVVVAVLGAFTGLSVHGAIGVRYFERTRYDLPRYVTTCLLLLMGSTAVAALLMLAFAESIESLTDIPRHWLLVAVGVAGAQFIVQVRLAIWQSAGQPWRFGGLRLAQSMIDAISSLLMVLALGMAWQGRVAGIALAATVAAAVACISLARDRWLVAQWERQYALDALRFGIPLIPHAVGGMLVAMADRFMITNLLDLASTGIYMVALQVGMALGLLTDSFNKAFAPWLMSSLGEKNLARDRQVVRFTYGYFVAVTVIALLLGLVAPGLLGVLVGASFRDAAPIIIYIALGQAFGGMYYMVANYIFFAGRTATLAGITLSCGVLNVSASYLLILHNGVIGAAQAFMLSQIVLFLGTWWLAQRSRPMPWASTMLLPAAAKRP